MIREGFAPPGVRGPVGGALVRGPGRWAGRPVEWAHFFGWRLGRSLLLTVRAGRSTRRSTGGAQGWPGQGFRTRDATPPHRESAVIMSADFIIHQGSAESANPIPDGS